MKKQTGPFLEGGYSGSWIPDVDLDRSLFDGGSTM